MKWKHSQSTPNLAEGSRTLPNQAEPSRTELCVCSVYTSSGILIAYSVLIAPRRCRHVMSRRSCRADWRFAFVVPLSSRRILCDVLLNTWRVVQGLDRSLSPHSHCKASRAEQNRTETIRLGKQTYVMKQKNSQSKPNRAERSRTEPNRTKPNRAQPSSTYVLCIPPQVSW